jgi:hypothetical protein
MLKVKHNKCPLVNECFDTAETPTHHLGQFSIFRLTHHSPKGMLKPDAANSHNSAASEATPQGGLSTERGWHYA